MAYVEAAFDHLDILINNAGMALVEAFDERRWRAPSAS